MPDVLDREDQDALSDERNPGQAHYDKAFADLTSPDHQSKDGVRKGLNDAEQSTAKGGGMPGAGGAGQAAKLATSVAGGGVGKLAKAANMFLGTRKRKAATVAGGAGLGLVGTGIVAFILLLAPLKVVNMVRNLQERFSAGTEQATKDVTEKLMQHYIVRKVMPGMVEGKCRSTKAISRSCALPSDGSNIIGQLYNAWKDAKLEGQLADQGIEIVRNNDNSFLLRTNGISQDIELGRYSDTVEFENRTFARMENRREVRAAIRTATDNVTDRRGMMQRFGVKKLLERKYGIRSCIALCDYRDDRQDRREAKQLARKRALASWLNERVFEPRNSVYGKAMSCALAGFGCTADGSRELSEDGESQSQFDRDVEAGRADERTRTGGDLDEVDARAENIRNKGVFVDLLEKIGTRLGLQAATKGAISSIPVAGQVYAAIDIASLLSIAAREGPDALIAMRHAVFMTETIGTWALYQTSADEIQHGKGVDATVVGSIAESLDAKSGNDNGGGSAEQTKLYSALSGGSSSSTSAFNVFTPAYAAGTTKQLCNDGEPIPSGKLICSELQSDDSAKLQEVAQIATIAGEVTPVGQLGKLTGVYVDAAFQDAQNWLFDKIGGILGGFFSGIVRIVPGAEALTEFSKYIFTKSGLQEQFANLGDAILKLIGKVAIPTIFPDKPSGGRMYEAAAAGAKASYNDYNHFGLGLRELNDQEAAAIDQRYLADQKQEFDSMSTFAKVFDTNSTASLVSRLSMTAPTNVRGASTTFSSNILANPLSSITGSFGALFSGRSQAADAALPSNLFGITTYGLTEADLQEIGDPEQYVTDNCSDMAEATKKWGEEAVKNSKTGQYENKKINYCKLLESGTMVAGGKFDTGLIPNYDPVTDSSAATETPGSFTIASYNIANALQHAAVGCAKGDLACTAKRTERQVKIIDGSNGNPAFSAVGLQEVSPPQLADLKTSLPNYDFYPTTVPDSRGIAIAWDKTKLTKVGEGLLNDVYDNAGDKYGTPWVKLQTAADSSGAMQTIYVLNIHSPNNGSGGSDAIRSYNAERYLQWATERNDGKALLAVTGDFNRDFRNNGNPATGAYCILTSSGVLANTYDLKQTPDKTKGCPSKDKSVGIDHVYLSPLKDVTVSKWAHMSKSDPVVAKASDHEPVYASFALANLVGGWVWPAEQIYPGPCWNSNSTGSYHAGMDMNTRAYGVPAKAAHSGTVFRTGTDGAAGKYITIKAGDGLYYSYEHLASITVTEGSVVAGQELGKIGATGNVQLSSSVGHLHMVVSTDGSLGSYSSTPQTSSNTKDPMQYLPKPAPSGYQCTQ